MCNDINNYERVINQSHKKIQKRKNVHKINVYSQERNKDEFKKTNSNIYSINIIPRKRTGEELENISLLFKEGIKDSFGDVEFKAKKFRSENMVKQF